MIGHWSVKRTINCSSKIHLRPLTKFHFQAPFIPGYALRAGLVVLWSGLREDPHRYRQTVDARNGARVQRQARGHRRRHPLRQTRQGNRQESV